MRLYELNIAQLLELEDVLRQIFDSQLCCAACPGYDHDKSRCKSESACIDVITNGLIKEAE